MTDSPKPAGTPPIPRTNSVKDRMAAFSLNVAKMHQSSGNLKGQSTPPSDVVASSPRSASFQKFQGASTPPLQDPSKTPKSSPRISFVPTAAIVANTTTYLVDLTFGPGQGCYFVKLGLPDGTRKSFNLLTTMFQAFSIKLLKGKINQEKFILLDGYYRPPNGPQKVFQDTTKFKDLGVNPAASGIHQFTFEIKQEERAAVVVETSLGNDVSGRRNIWSTRVKEAREKDFNINQVVPEKESKDLSSLVAKPEIPSSMSEFDAESAEKRAIAEYEIAQKERVEYLERQEAKKKEDEEYEKQAMIDAFCLEEAEKQMRGEVDEEQSHKNIAAFLANIELLKQNKMREKLDSLPGAAQLQQEEKERADVRAVETRKDIERRKEERAEEAARIKKAEEECTSVFKGSGKHVGVEIWRIENFEAEPWPKKDYGKFCTGDSYVCLQTVRIGGPWKIFFWLGAESSKDETGTAALKAIELDEVMGGSCPHSREVQYHESDTFQDLFLDYGGVNYMEGGVDSAFVKVERDVYPTRLLHCKGKKNVRVTPVPLTYKSLNSGDVFVLDAGLKLMQWCGKGSTRLERVKATQTIIRLRDSRGARAKYENFMEGEEPEEFWELLGDRGEIDPGDEEDDEAYEARMKELIKLYQVSDASGELEVKQVGSPPLLQKMLDTDDCFILDIGSEIFVWIGKGCTKQESSQSMAVAQKFLDENNRPSWTSITRMVEGAEIPSFIEQFRSWVGVDTTDYSVLPPTNTQHGRVAKRKVQHEIDVDSLIKAPTPDKEEVVEKKADYGYNYNQPDKFDTTVPGQLNVYRIENFKMEAIPRQQYGIFHAGDSYIATFVAASGATPPLVYYWLGKNSSRDEKGAAALLTRGLCKSENGKSPIITRVIQSKEPSHFLTLFKGKMVIKFGGVPSGFSNITEDTSEVHTGPSLYHVKGTTELDTKALQVTALTGNLNSADAFILCEPDMKKQFIWYGSGCEDVEKTTADSVGAFLRETEPGMECIAFDEGKEPDLFWKILGGKGKYLNDPDLQGDVKEPRMFSCSNASGVFEISECEYITQDDLDASDIFMLDTLSKCYIWVGPESNEVERKLSFEYGIKYVESALRLNTERPRICPIIVVDAGHEPPGFTCWFHGWDVQIALETAAATGLNPEAQASYNSKAQTGLRTVYEALKAYEEKTYPYLELRRDTVDKPLPNGGRGIDVTQLESYLSRDEFVQLFGMTKEQFAKEPDWKKRKVKGRLRLF